MAKKTPHRKQDRKRVSSQKHEISYTGRKVARKTGTTARKGKKAVKKAKRQTGTVTRRKVERRATKLARS